MTQPRALAFAPINVICSVQAEGPGEALAQLMAEKANPQDRLLVQRHRRPAPAGRRAGPVARIQEQEPEPRQPAPRGASAGRAEQVPHGGHAPNSGRILIDGRDVTLLGAAERNVSMVFQSHALFPHMDVLANVRYGLDVPGVSAAEAVRRARGALESVVLVGFDKRLPSELSGRQQQRVAVARSLVLAGQARLPGRAAGADSGHAAGRDLRRLVRRGA